MSNSWDYDTFSKYLGTDNEQYDFNEDNFVGQDDYADYLADQNAMEPSAMSGLNSLNDENFPFDQVVQDNEMLQDMEASSMSGLGDIDPNWNPDNMISRENAFISENFSEDSSQNFSADQSAPTGIVGTGTGMGQRGRNFRGIPSIFTAEDYASAEFDPDTMLFGYSLDDQPENAIYDVDRNNVVDANDLAIWLKRGYNVKDTDPITDTGKPFYKGIDPSDAAAASTFMGDLSRDDIDFQGYLYGDQINPPGFEKIFGEIERSPFRGDWDAGRYVPYTYDIDLDDPKFKAYEPARKFLSETFAKAEAAGFDSIERYLLDLDNNNDPNYETERDLYNYHAGKYEELATEYQAAQQQAFQEQMQGNNMQEWLGTDNGIKYINQAMGIFAAATGMNVSEIDPSIINLITSAASSGELAAFIGKYGLGAGESWAAAFAEELEIFKELTGATNADVFANPELVAVLREDATKRIGIEDPGTGGQQEGPDAGLDAGLDEGDGAGAGDGAGDGTITSAFNQYDTVPDKFKNNLNFGDDAGNGSGNYGLSFGDFQYNNEYINGVNPIMGYNPDKSIDWETKQVVAGDYVKEISDISANTADLAGFDTDGDNVTRYPKFLVEAANNESSELMLASGGDPFSWWDNLSQTNKNTFIENYSTKFENIGSDNNRILKDKHSFAIDNPNKDVYKRNSEGVITDHLMPRWMIEEQLNSGYEIDHRAWSNLSAEERNRLQSEISKSVKTLGDDGSNNLDLLSVTKLVDGNVEIASEFNTAGNLEFAPSVEDRSPDYVSSENDKLTLAEFGQVLIHAGFDTGAYQDVTDSNSRIDNLSSMGMAAWEKAGATEEQMENYMGRSSVYGEDSIGLGNRFLSSSQQNVVLPQEVLSYIFNNLDDYHELMGSDKYAILLPPSINEKTAFDAPTALWTERVVNPKGLNRDEPSHFVTNHVDDIDIGLKDILRELMGGEVGAYEDIKTFGDLTVNVEELDWPTFLGGVPLPDMEGGEEYFSPNGGFFESNEYGIPSADPYLDETPGKEWGNMLNAAMLFKSGGGGIHEMMAQVGKAYETYSREFDSKPDTRIDVNSFYENQRTKERGDVDFNSIVNLSERLKEQERIEELIDELYLDALETATFSQPSDKFQQVFEDIEGQIVMPDGSLMTINNGGFFEGGSVGPFQEDVLLNYASSLPGNPNMENRSAASSMYGEDSVRQIENLLAGGGYIRGRDGGMDDTVPAMTDGTQPAKLSSGEFVMPADVVSSLGDGNNENGAQKLYEMMDRIRAFKTGSLEQPPPVDDGSVMPV